MDPLLDVQDVDGNKVDPWNSSPLLSQHLATATPKLSWTESAWMKGPAAVLPPPPPAKLSTVQPVAPVTMDPWQSSAESSQRMHCSVSYLLQF